MTVAAPGVIDDAAIAFLRKCGGEVLVRRVVESFLDDAPGRISKAYDGLAAGDAATVGAAMHSLRSSAGQLGARRLMDVCAYGESIAGSAKESALAQVVREAEQELISAAAALEVLRAA